MTKSVSGKLRCIASEQECDQPVEKGLEAVLVAGKHCKFEKFPNKPGDYSFELPSVDLADAEHETS